MSSFVSKFINSVFSYFPWQFRPFKRPRDESSDLEDNTEVDFISSKRLKLRNSLNSKIPRDNGQVTTRIPSNNSQTKLRLTEDLFKPASYKPLNSPMPINWGRIQDDDGKPPKHVSSPLKSRNHSMAGLSTSTIDLTKSDVEENDRPRMSYVDLTRPSRKLPRRSLPLSSSITSYVDLTDQDNHMSPPEKKINHNNVRGGAGDSRGNVRQKGHFFSSKSNDRHLSLSSRYNRHSFDASSKSTKSLVSIDLTSPNGRRKNRDRSSLSSMSVIDLQEWNNYGKVLGSMLDNSVNLVSPPCSPTINEHVVDLTGDDDDDVVEVQNNYPIQKVKSVGSLYVQKPNEPSSAVASTTRNGVKKEIMRVNSFQNKILESPYAQDGWVQKLVKEYKDKYEEFHVTRDHFIKEVQKWSDATQRDIEMILEDKLNRHLKITEACLPEQAKEEFKSIILPIPELTDSMEKKVKSALVSKPATETLIRKFGLTINRCDIQTLNNLNWLNDEVINFYMQLIEQRSNEMENYPNVHTFNTFFYINLCNRGHEALKRWTKKVNIFEKDIIIIPIHLKMHWCLVVIDVQKKQVNYYDSMGHNNFECLTLMTKYLKAEYKHKNDKELDMDDWEVQNVKDIPRQMNGSDCGVFACTYAEYSARRAPFNFDQSKMKYFRRKMVYEIISGKLL